MTLKEYFRLPPYMRLSRKKIAKLMTAEGCDITPESVGLWVLNGSVPGDKRSAFIAAIRHDEIYGNDVYLGGHDELSAS